MSKYPTPRKYFPKQPEKYLGDVNNIISRSSWELKFMIWADNNPAIVKWNSEDLIVPYICGTDNKPHRYHLDFWMQVKTSSEIIKTHIVEIKPEAQTIMPKFPGKQTRRYITESMTYVKNQSKWKAATEYARQRGWEFTILTEKHLF